MHGRCCTRPHGGCREDAAMGNAMHPNPRNSTMACVLIVAWTARGGSVRMALSPIPSAPAHMSRLLPLPFTPACLHPPFPSTPLRVGYFRSSGGGTAHCPPPLSLPPPPPFRVRCCRHCRVRHCSPMARCRPAPSSHQRRCWAPRRCCTTTACWWVWGGIGGGGRPATLLQDIFMLVCGGGGKGGRMGESVGRG